MKTMKKMSRQSLAKGNQRHMPLDGSGDRGEGKGRLHPDGGYVKSKVNRGSLERGNKRHAPLDGAMGPVKG